MPDKSNTILGRLTRLPARLMIGVVRVYQLLISPVLPIVFGPNCGCRFYPTCSHYATEALRTHGAVAGGWLTLKRLLRCTPLHPGGIDHVPPSSKSWRTTPARPICQRVKSVSTQSLSHG